jgi:hypothetical protein
MLCFNIFLVLSKGYGIIFFNFIRIRGSFKKKTPHPKNKAALNNGNKKATADLTGRSEILWLKASVRVRCDTLPGGCAAVHQSDVSVSRTMLAA